MWLYYYVQTQAHNQGTALGARAPPPPKVKKGPLFQHSLIYFILNFFKFNEKLFVAFKFIDVMLNSKNIVELYESDFLECTPHPLKLSCYGLEILIVTAVL